MKKDSTGTFIVSTDIMGRMNIKKGIVEIYDKRLSGESLTVSLGLKNSYFKSATNSLVSFTSNSIEIK